ncbi:siderophore-interacting protein [Streptomyces sp. JJ38]|uniref:siderophore-interacting protein n=1 Tax=Streptomyces sp. JJ38 TaxID=2738128 RepID=UPI001C57CEEE|nr:siderophore-interacting protein [Streptomyces sp. JJ38]MBW1600080.1 siderophore-interacting protein [Streptomyces sp. JJ38]
MTEDSPFRFFAAHVLRSRRLSPTMTRVTLGGEELTAFASGGRDQSFSLFLPHPGQKEPVVPVTAQEGWFAAWRAMDPAVRAVMRSYTVREQRTERGEVDVDFALHGDDGPAARWAARCAPGDRVLLLGPAVSDNKAVGFRLPPGAGWTLLAGDETALPAIAGILRDLPPDHRTRVWIETPDAADRVTLPTRARADTTWLVRELGATHGELLLDAVRAEPFPGGAPYAWIAGEAAMVRSLRRHLVRERELPRSAVAFTGYWRRGASEEELREEALRAAS